MYRTLVVGTAIALALPVVCACHRLADFDRFGSPGCVPEDEFCDAQDNDCDGAVDEDFDLAADPANCGACGAACEQQPGSFAICTDSMCDNECMQDFANCNDDPGCETLLTSSDNCGSCGNACADGTPFCVDEACAAACPPGTLTCGAECVPMGRAPYCDECTGTCSLICSGSGVCDEVVDVSAAGRFTLALTESGRVLGWGDGGFGKLTEVTSSPTAHPVITSATDVVELAAGWDHSCAIRNAGDVVCWGRNEFGQLGIGSTSAQAAAPTPAVGLSSVNMIAVGFVHACAVATDRLLCWGNNAEGQVDPSRTGGTQPSPVQISVRYQGSEVTSPIVSLAAGGDSTRLGHTCIATDEGDVFCWGNAEDRQSCGGTAAACDDPFRRVEGVSGASLVVAAARHSCALADGGVYCWGRATKGRLGVPTRGPLPTAIPGSDDWDVVQLSAQGLHTCARSRTGQVTCWGDNQNYQISGESTEPVITPRLLALAPIRDISTGWLHSCAVEEGSQAVRCWGLNQLGALGVGEPGSPAFSRTPELVQPLIP